MSSLRIVSSSLIDKNDELTAGGACSVRGVLTCSSGNELSSRSENARVKSALTSAAAAEAVTVIKSTTRANLAEAEL
jgi:hypothetical protein